MAADDLDELDEFGLPGRRWGLIALVAVLVLGVVAGAAYAGYRVLDAQPDPISVRVKATGDVDELVEVDEDDPVSEALAAAGVATHDGRLLSVRDHDVLDDQVDPAEIRVDGKVAHRATALRDGSVVQVVDGEDRVEGTDTIPYDLPEAPLPDVMRHVQERGRPGTAEKVVGKVSKEILSRRTLTEPVDPVQTTQRVVALTFDDGPTDEWTPQVLQILAAKGVKATFCEIGEYVARRPDLAAQVVAGGHQLCNHTLAHDEGLRGAPQEQLDAQITGGHRAFTDAGLPEPPYYRPPGGFLSDAITATVRANGEQQITWKVDTEDWRRDANVLTIIDHVLRQVDDGAIILLHDGGGATRQATVDALPVIIDLLRAQGYGFTFPLTDPAPPVG